MILVIDATIRLNSRTKTLENYLLDKLDDKDVKVLRLEELNLKPLDNKTLEFRDKCILNNDYTNSYFALAKEVLKADKIIISAPFYDLSFPSSLKCFIEHITISGLLFKYNEGKPTGFLKATDLYFITTSGGPVFNHDYGYGYIDMLFTKMYGVKQTHLICAENLDIVGSNIENILNDAKKCIDKLIK